MENVLVTGGAGFVGSHLVDGLLAQGLRVTVVDSLEQQVHRHPPDYLDPRARYVFARVGDDRVDWPALLDGVDTVYYLASRVGPAQSMEQIADYIDANVGDLAVFLQALRDAGDSVRRLVLSASMAPYGEGRYRCAPCDLAFYPGDRALDGPLDPPCPRCGAAARNLPLDEQTLRQDISYYGYSKNAQDAMLALHARSFGKQLVSLRYFSVYGPRQTLGNPYGGPIPIWIDRARRGEPLLVFEDGQQTRDFIHVADITRINLAAGAVDVSEPVTVINCGTGVGTPIVDVARQIAAHYGGASEVRVTGDRRAGDLRHSLADNARLRALLGVDRFVALPDGVAQLLDWVDQRPRGPAEKWS